MVANHLASGTHQDYKYSVGSPETEKDKSEHKMNLKNGNNSYVQSFDDYCSLRNRAIKHEQITEWTARISDLNKQIEKIKINRFLSNADKQKQIARRMDIICFFEKKIVDTEIFLGIRRMTTAKAR